MPENDVTELQTLDIYQLTEEQYNDLVSSSELDPNAIYMTPAGDPLSTLLSLIYPVGAVYQNTTNVNPSTFIPGTTWQLISSVALASEHIFGNGLSIGMTTGSNNITLGLLSGGSGNPLVSGAGGGYGHNVGTSMGGNSGNTQPSYSLGLKTKSALGDYPEYSGLIADTITVYMWERTA